MAKSTVDGGTSFAGHEQDDEAILTILRNRPTLGGVLPLVGMGSSESIKQLQSTDEFGMPSPQEPALTTENPSSPLEKEEDSSVGSTAGSGPRASKRQSARRKNVKSTPDIDDWDED